MMQMESSFIYEVNGVLIYKEKECSRFCLSKLNSFKRVLIALFLLW